MQQDTIKKAQTAIPSATGALRIAVSSRDGTKIDKPWPERGVSGVRCRGRRPVLIERRDVASHTQGDEDVRDTICRLLADRGMLLVAKIGSAPQEKLAGAGIQASDLHVGKKVDAALAEAYAAKTAADPNAAVNSTNFRLAHAMLRVSDIDRSVDFYTRLLGMRLLERRDHKKNQFSQAYLGYGEGFAQMAIELVFNWAREEPTSRATPWPHRDRGPRHLGALRSACRGRRPRAATAARPAARRKYRRFRRGSGRPSDRTGAAAVGPVNWVHPGPSSRGNSACSVKFRS